MNRAAVYRTGLFRALLSAALALLIAGIIVQATGYSAVSAFSALWSGATGLEAGPAMGPSDVTVGTGHLRLFQLAQSLAKVTPLLFCGLAVALALRAGLFNIGAQGQMTVGALCAAAVGLIGSGSSPPLPAAVHVPLTIAAGALGGAAWGALPGLLKAMRGVHEVISTIMLNFIGLHVVNYLVTHGLKDVHSSNIQTAQMAPGACLTPLVPHSNLTAGLLLALLAAAAYSFFIARTSAGFAIRAVGLNGEAARASGISTSRTIVLSMALSGGLAGVAGAVEVMSVHHRFVDAVAGSYGFDGIAVALLAGLTGGGAILSALFFGFLATGSDQMQALTSVQAPIAVVIQAVVILLVGVRSFGFPRRAPAVAASPPGSPETTPSVPSEGSAISNARN